MDTMRIDRFTSRIDADIACAMLQARGIQARVAGDDAGGVHPDIPFGIGGTAVVVPREQHDEAVALLDEEFVGYLGDDDAEGTVDDARTGPTDGAGDRTGGDSTDGGLDGPGMPADADGRMTRRRAARVFAAVVVAILAITAIAGGWSGWI